MQTSQNVQVKIFFGLMWSLIEKCGNEIIGVIVFYILAKILVPEAFGLMAITNIALILFNILSEQGFSIALIQKEKIDDFDKDTAFWASFAVSIFMCCLGIILSPFISQIFEQPQLENILYAISFLVILNPFYNIPITLLKKNLNFKIISYINLFANSIAGAAAIYMALHNYGVWSLVAKRLVETTLHVILFISYTKWFPGNKYSQSHLKDLTSLGRNIVTINLLQNWKRQILEILISYHLGAKTLGYYKVSERILLTVNVGLVLVIFNVMLPAFSLLQKDWVRLKSTFISTIKYTALFCFPIYIYLFIFAQKLISLFLDNWALSGAILQIISLHGIMHTLTKINYNLIIAINKANWRLKTDTLHILLLITGFYIIKSSGIIAIVYMIVAISTIMLIIDILPILPLVNISYREYLFCFQKIFLFLVISFLTTKQLLSLHNITNILDLIFHSILFFATYFVLLIVFERETLKSLFQNIKSTISK